MSLSYNSWFFKIYCNFFAKKIGVDNYGNQYFQKKNPLKKIILGKEGSLFTKEMLRQVKFLKNGMHGFII